MGSKRPRSISNEEITSAVASLRRLAELQSATQEQLDALLVAAWNTQQRLLAISVASTQFSVLTGRGAKLAPFPEWRPDLKTSRRLRLSGQPLKNLRTMAQEVLAESARQVGCYASESAPGVSL